MLVYVLAVVVFGLDQLVKYIVRTTMAVNQMIPIWPHVLVLDYIQNPGAAWGMLGHARYFLILVALIVIGAVVYVQSKYRPKIGYQIGLGLVLGGALGNLMDRIVYGKVTDFIYFQIINFPVFNLADSAITIGVILILLLSLRSGQNRPNGPSQDTQ
ncbi:signal peptidase II [Alicyclobacillus mengziensis]|uniref:Lipoprotein signal peptidase n=1 Tax=Alicyclobacillus mengziensis TaxID=2931921 RepID=A0A9X7W357_9BACL|nr:signal peptidase II [Alicyclobacillus mengziensis]QSO49484.1 signal peptidase II [Alicyclobacillus mengziensis]